MKIIVLVPMILYALFYFFAYKWASIYVASYHYLHPEIREQQIHREKEEITLHGDECIKKAVPIGDGHVFGFCKIIEGDYRAFLYVVYDSSDQVMLPTGQRSNQWMHMYLNNSSARWDTQNFKAEKIDGHFYALVTGESWGVDPVALCFKWEHEIHWDSPEELAHALEKANCKKFNTSKTGGTQ